MNCQHCNSVMFEHGTGLYCPRCSFIVSSPTTPIQPVAAVTGTPTPRTDKATSQLENGSDYYVEVDFARQLETELVSSEASLKAANEKLAEAAKRIWDLAENGSLLQSRLTALEAELKETDGTAETLDNLYVAAQRKLTALEEAAKGVLKWRVETMKTGLGYLRDNEDSRLALTSLATLLPDATRPSAATKGMTK